MPVHSGDGPAGGDSGRLPGKVGQTIAYRPAAALGVARLDHCRNKGHQQGGFIGLRPGHTGGGHRHPLVPQCHIAAENQSQIGQIRIRSLPLQLPQNGLQLRGGLKGVQSLLQEIPAVGQQAGGADAGQGRVVVAGQGRPPALGRRQADKLRVLDGPAAGLCQSPGGAGRRRRARLAAHTDFDSGGVIKDSADAQANGFHRLGFLNAVAGNVRSVVQAQGKVGIGGGEHFRRGHLGLGGNIGQGLAYGGAQGGQGLHISPSAIGAVPEPAVRWGNPRPTSIRARK